MNKKTILFAALVAASSTAFISCSSSDEDLLAQEPVAPASGETVTPEKQNSGIPLVVNATTSDGTRATGLSNSNFSSFQLWAFQGTDPWVGNAYDGENRQTGKEMEKTGDPAVWNAPGDYWPSANVNSKFYAISSSYNAVNALWPNITNTSASFTYTVGDYAGADQWIDPDDHDKGKYVDNQEDLLVGSATASAETDEGKVNIEFTHALTKVNFTFKIDPANADPEEWSASSDQGLCAIIDQIELHNIKRTGVYTFGSGWNSDEDADETIIIKPDQPIQVVVGFNYQDTPTEAFVEDAFGKAVVNADAYITKPAMVLPQEVEAICSFDKLTSAPDGAYLVLKAKTVLYTKPDALDYFTTAEDGDNNKLFHKSGEYFLDASDNVVAREDGVILDFSKLPADHEIDLQIRTSADGAFGGDGQNITGTGYGSIYKPLGAASGYEFTAGKPYRFNINLLTGTNDDDLATPWGDFGTGGASRQLGDIITEE